MRDLMLSNVGAAAHHTSSGSHKAKAWIEATLTQVLEDIEKGAAGKPSVRLRRLDGYQAVPSEDFATAKFQVTDHPVKYAWPGQTGEEAWRFGHRSPLY
jgi:hypothetical protein